MAGKSAMVIVRGQLAFAQQIFDAESFEGGGVEYYGTQVLIDPESEDFKRLSAAIESVKKAADLGKLRADRVCVTDGDETDYDTHQDKKVLRASRRADKGRPITVDKKLQPCVQEDGLLYSGATANVKISVWAQDNKYGKRINAELLAVQFVEHGDNMGGSVAPTIDGFDAIDDPDEAPFDI